MNYQELYNRKSELKTHLQLAREYQDKFELECAAEYKKQFPRKRKPYTPKDFNLLENGKAIYEKFAEELRQECAKSDAEVTAIDAQLKELANTVDLTPGKDTYHVRTSSSNTYRSQGWGANKYAKGTLLEDCELLKRRGFSAEIVVTSSDYVKDMLGYGYNWEEYALATNATPVQFDAILRMDYLTEQECAEIYYLAGVNPKVYYGGGYNVD